MPSSELHCQQKNKFPKIIFSKLILLAKRCFCAEILEKRWFWQFFWNLAWVWEVPEKFLKVPETQRLSPHARKLFCKQDWKKVSSINYIPWDSQELFNSEQFSYIFLIFRKTTFLEGPKVLVYMNIICLKAWISKNDFALIYDDWKVTLWRFRLRNLPHSSQELSRTLVPKKRVFRVSGQLSRCWNGFFSVIRNWNHETKRVFSKTKKYWKKIHGWSGQVWRQI